MTTILRASNQTAFRKSITAMVSLAALAAANPGRAQSESAAQAGASSNRDQTIVVTAQRRSELLQDVPLSITAVTSEGLENAGVETTRDLALVTPSIRIDAIGVFVQPAIRGITTTQTSAGGEPNVATYLDGVYQHLQTALVFDLPDVERVEVLKGPQGTLFGRNATGGAILIHTIDPDLNNATGKASFSYGNFQSVKGEGFFSFPVVEDKLAFSITALGKSTDGYKRDLITGNRVGSEDAWLLRGKVRFTPWEGADFVLTGMYSDLNDYNSLKYTNYQGNNVAPLLGLDPALVPDKPYEYASNFNAFSGVEQHAVSLRGTIELGPGTLTNVTSYSKYETLTVLDGDFTPAEIISIITTGKSRAYTQELVYATDQLGRFRGVFGLNYFNAKSKFIPVNINNYQLAIWPQDNVEAIAGFGEVTFDISDRLAITGGLRYSREKVTTYSLLNFGTSEIPTDIPLLGKKTFNSVTPRVSLVYKVTPETNLYATYSQGFKSGVFNATSLQQGAVDPEKIDAFEVGVKSSEVDRLTFSLAGYYYDYADLQVISFTVDPNGVQTSRLENAAQAEIYGAELNASWRPTPEFSLNLNAGYLHARYDSFPAASVLVPTGFGGNTTENLDISGNTIIRSPEWSGSVTANYVKEIDAGTFDLSATLFYSSKIYHDVGNRIVQPSFAQINASLGWKPADMDLEIRLWGRNLTDKAVLTTTILQEVADGVGYAPPRTYGIELKYSY